MAIELKDLTAEERLALVALVELAIGADARVSEAERERIANVVQAVGRPAYEKAVAEVDRRFTERETLRTFLATIERQGAREAIYETLLEVSTADVIDNREVELLDWLARTWGVRTKAQP